MERKINETMNMQNLLLYKPLLKKLLFVSLFSVYGMYAKAQCDFTLNAEVLQHTDCAATGIIRVSLSGDDVDLSVVQIILRNGGNIDLLSTASSQDFTTLPGGDYTIQATTICRNSSQSITKTATLTIQSSGTAMGTYISGYQDAMECGSANTGMISFYIYDGKTPYTVKMTSSPSGYSGTTEFVQNSSGTLVINNLPAGVYSFSITDACSYNKVFSRTLQLVSNFPSDFFSYSSRIGEPPNSCNEITIRMNNSIELSDDDYDISFSVNSNNLEWTRTESSPREYKMTLPYTIREMLERQYTITAKSTVKYCNRTVNEEDIISMPQPYINDNFGGINCNIFQYVFRVHNICYPFKWEIYEDETNTMKGSGVVSEVLTENISVDIEQYKKYILTVTDNDGYELTREISAVTHQMLYYYSYGVNFCLPDTFTAFYYFGIKTLGDPVKISAGTRIKQTNGSTVINPDVTIGANIEYYYPFSQDYTKQENVKIEEGHYTFEISTCGEEPFEISFWHYNYSFHDLSYVEKEECDGLHVFPVGQFYQGNNSAGAYYKMVEAPAGVDLNIGNYQLHSSETDPVHTTGRYFLLPQMGKYIFQVSRDYDGCPIDSVEIDYAQIPFDLDDRSVYTCSASGMPHFNLSAKGGIAPYTYELIENGTVVSVNNTGNFIYGNTSNTYSARVTDACGTNLTTDLQVIDFFTDAIITGTDKICLGGTISLSCLSLGASGFDWEGPAGFYSTEQNVSIPNVTYDNIGQYRVTIQPYGCSDPITMSFNVSIYTPSVPSAPDTVMFCENGNNTLPEIETIPEHSLVWYAEDGITGSSTPEINTGSAHKEIYYISQKNEVLGCESDKHKIVFIVNPLPSSDIDARIVACSGKSPVIEIQNPVKDYIYSIYADYETTNRIAEVQATDDDISETLPVTITQNTTYYISITDKNGCISLPLAKDAVVIELHILPEYLPTYKTGVEYEQTLTTNAELPDFSVSAGQLPNGLTLYSTGLISGIASSDNNATSIFTAAVKDVNGCTVSREYIFERVMFAPRVFTPDNDGINDVFMSGNKVIIFDRVGIIIYEGLDGWDGTYKGKPAPPDIYFYKLYYMENDVQKMTTGYIGLIRK